MHAEFRIEGLPKANVRTLVCMSCTTVTAVDGPLVRSFIGILVDSGSLVTEKEPAVVLLVTVGDRTRCRRLDSYVVLLYAERLINR